VTEYLLSNYSQYLYYQLFDNGDSSSFMKLEVMNALHYCLEEISLKYPDEVDPLLLRLEDERTKESEREKATDTHYRDLLTERLEAPVEKEEQKEDVNSQIEERKPSLKKMKSILSLVNSQIAGSFVSNLFQSVLLKPPSAAQVRSESSSSSPEFGSVKPHSVIL
jgi:hypothetical protein